MNRRDFIRTLAVGAPAVALGVAAAPEAARSWVGVDLAGEEYPSAILGPCARYTWETMHQALERVHTTEIDGRKVTTMIWKEDAPDWLVEKIHSRVQERFPGTEWTMVRRDGQAWAISRPAGQ